jgi:hypothetical protein
MMTSDIQVGLLKLDMVENKTPERKFGTQTEEKWELGKFA